METYRNDSSSGTNTILIVVVLVLLVGFGVWWFSSHRTASSPSDLNVDVNLPTGDGGSSPAPSGGTTTP